MYCDSFCLLIFTHSFSLSFRAANNFHCVLLFQLLEICTFIQKCVWCECVDSCSNENKTKNRFKINDRFSHLWILPKASKHPNVTNTVLFFSYGGNILILEYRWKWQQQKIKSVYKQFSSPLNDAVVTHARTSVSMCFCYTAKCIKRTKKYILCICWQKCVYTLLFEWPSNVCVTRWYKIPQHDLLFSAVFHLILLFLYTFLSGENK